MQYCTLQHRTLLLSPVTFTTGCCFCFGSIPSFFLELFLHWSPVAYWAPTDLGSSSFSILSFCLLYCSWGSQGKNTEVVCHSLLQWTTFCQTSPPCPVRLGWPHTTWLSFTELDKSVVHVIRLTSFLWLWFHCRTTMCKIARGKLQCSTGSSAQCSGMTQRGRMTRSGGERCKREGTYVCIELIHCVVQQKATTL